MRLGTGKGAPLFGHQTEARQTLKLGDCQNWTEIVQEHLLPEEIGRRLAVAGAEKNGHLQDGPQRIRTKVRQLKQSVVASAEKLKGLLDHQELSEADRTVIYCRIHERLSRAVEEAKQGASCPSLLSLAGEGERVRRAETYEALRNDLCVNCTELLQSEERTEAEKKVYDAFSTLITNLPRWIDNRSTRNTQLQSVNAKLSKIFSNELGV